MAAASMKPFRLIALALVLAVVGAGIALYTGHSSATVLCSEASALCEEKGVLEEGTAIAAKLKPKTESIFVTSAGKVVCNEALLEGETTAEEDAALPLQIATMKFSSCTLGGKSCTLTALNQPYSGLLYAVDEGDGVLYASEEKGVAEPGQEVVCTGLECAFTTPEMELGFNAGKPATIVAKEIELEGEGEKESCAEALWSAEYELTEPNEGSVSAAEANRDTWLCQDIACNTPYLANQKLKGSNTSTVFELLHPVNRTITCTSSTIKGLMEIQHGSPLLTEMEVLESNDCTTPDGGSPKNCNVKETGVPYLETGLVAERFRLPAGSGYWRARLRVKVECAALNIKDCVLEKEAAIFIKSGSPGRIEPSEWLRWNRRLGGTGCSNWIRWIGLYPLSEPNGGAYLTEN